ncbi:MAG: S4 domain-containing protein [Tepidisphaeraceae bacterium]
MSTGKNYHLRDVLDGASLSQVLKQLLREASWSQVKQLIANRHIHVNGNLCVDEGRRLKTGDVVKVFDQPLAKPVSAQDVIIRYRDEHLVVVEKPAGVNSLRHAEERNWPAHRKAQQPSLDELVNAALAGNRPPVERAKTPPQFRKGPPPKRRGADPGRSRFDPYIASIATRRV